MRSSLLLGAFGIATAYDLPTNLRNIYNNHQRGDCQKILSAKSLTGAVFCGDIPNSLFLKSNHGYEKMDVDCNGSKDCSSNPAGYGETTFKDIVSQYGISDLNANIHPYVVFNEPPFFNPQEYGMKPLSVTAVICNGQVWYGIWGDTNQKSITGAASVSLARLCFPKENLDGDRGHSEKDVLYIGFTGDEAMPSMNGTNWKANNVHEFMASIKATGDKLVSQLAL